MFKKLDEPIIKPLLDVENLDTKYISNSEISKSYGLAQQTLKYYINSYEFINDGKVFLYHKKEDVIALSKLREKFDKIKNLMPILNVKDSKTLKSFFEKYKIRYLHTGMHPFGVGHMYYKEDLEIIKEIRSKTTENRKMKSKNRKRQSKGYYAKAIKIEDFDITEYYTVQEAYEIIKECGFDKPILYYAIQPYIYNEIIYLKKSDVQYWGNKSKDLIKISDAKKIFNYKKSDWFIEILKKNKIRILVNKEHPYGREYLMYKEDIENLKILIDKGINFEDYMTISEVRSFLGIKTTYKTIKRFVEPPVVIKKVNYFKKNDIYELRKYITDTIALDDLVKKYGDKIGRKKIVKVLKNNNIKIIYPQEHPFIYGYLVLKKDLDEINNIIEFEIKLDSSGSRRKKFDLLISKIPEKESIKETLKEFSGEFVVERLNNKQSDDCLYVPLYNTYVLICDILQKNLHEYSDKDIQRFLSIVFNDERINNNVKIEFLYFCNFSNKKHKRNVLPYKLNQGDLVKKPMEKISYSREQILELFGLLYSSLNDREYLNKALDKRKYAMVWLYMYMHYIVFWRTSTMKDIPKPNLKVIGFNSGEEFLSWCKEPTNIFTEDMGVKICASVKIQIDSLEITARKNGQPLIFEYGKLMSRGLGLLLAICEAHRQRLEQAKLQRKDKFYRRHDTDRLITNNLFEINNYKGLFGEKYTNIFGEQVFSNLAMERAFNNYTLDYSEENNNSLGTHILSIMRSHVIDINGISNTTPNYETRVKEGTIGDIVAVLEEIGAFGFAKHTLLTICDKEYKAAKLTERNKKIVDLAITPNQAEGLVRVVAKQRQYITNLLTKMIVNPDIAEIVLKELAYGTNVAGKHEHSRCLLKVLLNLHNDEVEEEIYTLDLGTNEEIRNNCLMPSANQCFTCPLLIGQIYLLYELNDVINDAINTIKSSNNDFEKLIQSTLIFESYLPILYEAQDVLGNDMVGNYIDLEHICNNLIKLESEGKILLKE